MQFDEKPDGEEGAAPTSPDTATPAPTASGAADDEANSAVAMLIRNTDKIPVRPEGSAPMTAAATTKWHVGRCTRDGPRPQINTVVDQLRKYPKLLHKYLHALFVKDPHVGSAYHELQVELYAEYEPSKLLPFLRQSNHYPLKMVRTAEGRQGRAARQTHSPGARSLGRGGSTAPRRTTSARSATWWPRWSSSWAGWATTRRP